MVLKCLLMIAVCNAMLLHIITTFFFYQAKHNFSQLQSSIIIFVDRPPFEAFLLTVAFRGEWCIFGQFLQFQLWQRFFPLIFTHFLFQSVNFIPNSFLFPNLFSNVVLVINLFFYFYFSRSFFFWCVWCISGHFNFLVFLFLN